MTEAEERTWRVGNRYARFGEFLRGLIAPEINNPSRIARHLVHCEVNDLYHHAYHNPASLVEVDRAA